MRLTVPREVELARWMELEVRAHWMGLREVGLALRMESQEAAQARWTGLQEEAKAHSMEQREEVVRAHRTEAQEAEQAHQVEQRVGKAGMVEGQVRRRHLARKEIGAPLPETEAPLQGTEVHPRESEARSPATEALPGGRKGQELQFLQPVEARRSSW